MTTHPPGSVGIGIGTIGDAGGGIGEVRDPPHWLGDLFRTRRSGKNDGQCEQASLTGVASTSDICGQRCHKAIYCGVHAAGDAGQAPAGARGTEGLVLSRVTGVGSGDEFSFNNRAVSGPHSSAGLIMAYSGKLFVGSTVKNPSADPLPGLIMHRCAVSLGCRRPGVEVGSVVHRRPRS